MDSGENEPIDLEELNFGAPSESGEAGFADQKDLVIAGVELEEKDGGAPGEFGLRSEDGKDTAPDPESFVAQAEEKFGITGLEVKYQPMIAGRFDAERGRLVHIRNGKEEDAGILMENSGAASAEQKNNFKTQLAELAGDGISFGKNVLVSEKEIEVIVHIISGETYYTFALATKFNRPDNEPNPKRTEREINTSELHDDEPLPFPSLRTEPQLNGVSIYTPQGLRAWETVAAAATEDPNTEQSQARSVFDLFRTKPTAELLPEALTVYPQALDASDFGKPILAPTEDASQRSTLEARSDGIPPTDARQPRKAGQTAKQPEINSLGFPLVDTNPKLAAPAPIIEHGFLQNSPQETGTPIEPNITPFSPLEKTISNTPTAREAAAVRSSGTETGPTLTPDEQAASPRYFPSSDKLGSTGKTKSGSLVSQNLDSKTHLSAKLDGNLGKNIPAAPAERNGIIIELTEQSTPILRPAESAPVVSEQADSNQTAAITPKLLHGYRGGENLRGRSPADFGPDNRQPVKTESAGIALDEKAKKLSEQSRSRISTNAVTSSRHLTRQAYDTVKPGKLIIANEPKSDRHSLETASPLMVLKPETVAEAQKAESAREPHQPPRTILRPSAISQFFHSTQSVGRLRSNFNNKTAKAAKTGIRLAEHRTEEKQETAKAIFAPKIVAVRSRIARHTSSPAQPGRKAAAFPSFGSSAAERLGLGGANVAAATESRRNETYHLKNQARQNRQETKNAKLPVSESRPASLKPAGRESLPATTAKNISKQPRLGLTEARLQDRSQIERPITYSNLREGKTYNPISAAKSSGISLDSRQIRISNTASPARATPTRISAPRGTLEILAPVNPAWTVQNSGISIIDDEFVKNETRTIGNAQWELAAS